MKNKVITAVIKGSDTAYLSAIFEDNKLVGIVQNKMFHLKLIQNMSQSFC